MGLPAGAAAARGARPHPWQDPGVKASRRAPADAACAIVTLTASPELSVTPSSRRARAREDLAGGQAGSAADGHDAAEHFRAREIRAEA